MSNDKETIKPGDLVELISPSRKVYIFSVISGKQLQTHRGIIYHDDLIGKPWGIEIHSHIGSVFYLLQPSLADVMSEIPRSTQIMYPKDIGFLLVTMGIGPGTRVLEAGSGSGALTIALAWAVGPHGKVTSYEIKPDVKNLAQKNIRRVGLDKRVEFKVGDIANGFDERQVDAIFLDVQNAYDYMNQVKEALKPGGYFGCLLPTVNQVIRLLGALYANDFRVVDVCEILLRYYKPVQDRLRPTDRMVAHTGYLTFGRVINYQYSALEKEANEENRAQNLTSHGDIS